jgi:hypothetical protein
MDSRLTSNYNNTLILAQAHAPTKLIAIAPSTTHEQAPTRRKPRSVLQLLSLRKSTTRSSVSEAYINRPAEMAFMMPTSKSPDPESGLYEECKARPIAWPIGVLRRSVSI